MSRKIFFVFVLFFSFSSLVFARGKVDEAEVKTQNDEWILCITDFDTSSLMPERVAVSGVIMRKLANNLTTINYRTRISSEYTYYEEAAWRLLRSNVTRSLAAKQNERSLLLYRGESSRVYRRNIARVDSEIEKLLMDLEEIDNNAPVINREPVFKLTAGNLENQFPPAPKDGGEYRFCVSQRADAFLEGKITDYHGRFLVTLKLYTLYTQSYVWEDAIVFSHDDLDDVLEDFTQKLLLTLSGNRPAALTVRVEPQDTLVLINRSFVGRGDSSVLEYAPGTITVTASAPNYESLTFETELLPGQLTDISINLNPVEEMEIEITGNDKGLPGSIYQGALYIGETPLMLRLPIRQLEFVEMEAEDDSVGRIVFQMPDASELNHYFSLQTSIPPRHGRVDTARRIKYWAWGATWFAGITAWITSYAYPNMSDAYTQGGTHNQQLFDDASRMYNIHIGSLIALGALAAIDIFLIGRYIYIANKGATSIRSTETRTAATGITDPITELE